jgi:hypothetical protein
MAHTTHPHVPRQDKMTDTTQFHNTVDTGVSIAAMARGPNGRHEHTEPRRLPRAYRITTHSTSYHGAIAQAEQRPSLITITHATIIVCNHVLGLGWVSCRGFTNGRKPAQFQHRVEMHWETSEHMSA